MQPAMNVEDFPVFLSANDIAALMGISRPLAYKLVGDAEKNGWFPVHRIGSSRKVKVSKKAFLYWANGFIDNEGLQ